MKASCSTIQFRIDIDFEECDVDMVYKEMRQKGYSGAVPHLLCGVDDHKVKGNRTPISDSVNFALEWLMGYVDRNQMCTTSSKWDTDYSKPSITAHTKDGTKYTTWPSVVTEMEQLGLEVVSTEGLMMGTCHLICEVDADKFSVDLVNKATQVVQKIFKRFVRYYKENKHTV